MLNFCSSDVVVGGQQKTKKNTKLEELYVVLKNGII